MNAIRTITVAMLIAWIGCLAWSERPFDDALETDGSVKPAKRNDVVDLTDFDPLEAKPAGVIKPRNHSPAAAKKPVLPLEGSKVVDRLCRIKPDPSGWVLVLFPTEGDRKVIRPRWALPNKVLEAVEALHAKTPDIMFRVSGEMTVYRDNSFILLRRVGIVEPERDEPVEYVSTDVTPVAPKAETQPADSAKPSPETQPKTKTGAGPSSVDLMKTLLSEKNPTPVILPRRKTKTVAAKVKSVAPGAKGDIIEPATARLVVDRLMTIRKTNLARWREATFEADNTLREPPVTLLPCRLLSYAEKQPPTRRLRVTGEVMRYKGKRYMLLRKVIIERVMNRL